MQINWRNVLPKFIEFCMELPFCCPSQGHQCGPIWQLEANTNICHWVLLWKHEFITANWSFNFPSQGSKPPCAFKFFKLKIWTETIFSFNYQCSFSKYSWSQVCRQRKACIILSRLIMLAYTMIYHTSCRQQDRSQEVKARVKIPHPLCLKKTKK